MASSRQQIEPHLRLLEKLFRDGLAALTALGQAAPSPSGGIFGGSSGFFGTSAATAPDKRQLDELLDGGDNAAQLLHAASFSAAQLVPFSDVRPWVDSLRHPLLEPLVEAADRAEKAFPGELDTILAAAVGIIRHRLLDAGPPRGPLNGTLPDVLVSSHNMTASAPLAQPRSIFGTRKPGEPFIDEDGHHNTISNILASGEVRTRAFHLRKLLSLSVISLIHLCSGKRRFTCTSVVTRGIRLISPAAHAPYLTYESLREAGTGHI